MNNSSREPRGFAIYVGLSEADAAAAGISLRELVDDLKQTISERAPKTETHAALALAPKGAGGNDLEIVRMALHDPVALGKLTRGQQPNHRVVIDISRKRVLIDDQISTLTYKEFSLLQYLVLREGQTVDRDSIISALWANLQKDNGPETRTIDVHIRRLRSKLEPYEDIVRTVRGLGYRFDRHPDVDIKYGVAQSPDMF